MTHFLIELGLFVIGTLIGICWSCTFFWVGKEMRRWFEHWRASKPTKKAAKP